MSYGVEYRKRVIGYQQEGNSLRATSRVFKVNVSTILEWETQMEEKGHLEKKELHRTHKKIDPEKLHKYVTEHPDAYQSEIAEYFCCSQAAVSKALMRHGYTRKKRV